MSYCDDCGCRMSGGICSNCDEELYILTHQAEDLDDVRLSDEFLSKAKEQAQRRAPAATPRRRPAIEIDPNDIPF